ncbi:hypothetical protein L0152_16080 [bacterium]|nr:hypothetical protein [bacterium]
MLFLDGRLEPKEDSAQGPDSVWFCLLENNERITLENPLTRHEAFLAIELVLQSMIKTRSAAWSVLIFLLDILPDSQNHWGFQEFPGSRLGNICSIEFKMRITMRIDLKLQLK